MNKSTASKRIRELDSFEAANDLAYDIYNFVDPDSSSSDIREVYLSAWENMNFMICKEGFSMDDGWEAMQNVVTAQFPEQKFPGLVPCQWHNVPV